MGLMLAPTFATQTCKNNAFVLDEGNLKAKLYFLWFRIRGTAAYIKANLY